MAALFRREAAQVSRAICSALVDGLVTVQLIDNCGRRSARLPDLERRLKERYSRLRLALVVESPPIVQAGSDQLAFSDEVHRRMGVALAEEIARGGFVRDGESIGVGSGRGVYETVRALQKQPPLRARGVSLVSLSGMGYTRHHAMRRNLILDADFLVSFMGQAFADPVTLHLVSSALIHETIPNLTPEPWIQQDERKRAHLGTALMGVGVFAPGNRFFEESDPDPIHHQDAYEVIRAQLRSLRTTAVRLEKSGHRALADLGYHLLIVPPRQLSEADRELVSLLKRQAATINRCILSATPSHFSHVKTLTIIAGTDVKAMALDYVLTNTAFPPVNLCTDETAARNMLRLAKVD